jgi:hypothetical protein
MKYIGFYKTKKLAENKVFDYFVETIKSSIKTWEYFINWDKVNYNVDQVKIELNLLNSLLDSNNLEEDFKKLIIEYPNVVKTMPVLLAVRDNKLEILDDYKNQNLDTIDFNFCKRHKISYEETNRYLDFLNKSGLIELFKNKKIKNFVDYVFGVEVGLDSNGRKNRGGSLMEDIVEVFVKRTVERNQNLEYLPQATSSKIKSKWNYNVEFDKSQRQYDFAIYNKKTNKLFLIETNFYNGGGSKLKAVCGEFKTLFNELEQQNIDLIWITDGLGWITTKRPLEETFNNNNYVFNLSMLEDKCLDEVVDYEN